MFFQGRATCSKNGGGWPGDQSTPQDLNSDNSDCEQEDSKDGAVAKRKSSESRTSLARNSTVLDSSADSKAEPRSPQRFSPKAGRTLSTRGANAWAVGFNLQAKHKRHGTDPLPRSDSQ